MAGIVRLAISLLDCLTPAVNALTKFGGDVLPGVASPWMTPMNEVTRILSGIEQSGLDGRQRDSGRP
jgi:hypothetical protein